MKLGKGISWLMGNLQRSLFPQLEECWGTALTEKQQQLVSILGNFSKSAGRHKKERDRTKTLCYAQGV
jgi:hypothetical protein